MSLRSRINVDFYVTCPHCGHKQHLVWDRVQDANKDTEKADPLSGDYYICESCDRPIEEKYKSQMVLAGSWEQTAKAKDPKHVRFHSQDGAEFKLRATCIDSGYLTQKVYQRCKQYRYLH